uniref:Serine protease easter-like n=1 Tax=Drosophila rhopaloa TaxID=1041015 RepID=A0A6P4DUP9_DRORH
MTAGAWFALLTTLLFHKGSAQFLNANCGSVSSNQTVSPYPWLAIIELPTKKCSGTLVNRNYVITSATCVFDQKIATVRLGVFDRSKLGNSGYNYSEEVFQMQSAYVPEFYNQTTRKNDIALLKLSNPVVYKDHIRPICILLDNSIVKIYDAIFAIRWGLRKKKNMFPGPKLSSPKSFNSRMCREVSQICAGYKTNCVEPGSPLTKSVVYSHYIRLVLFGIQSYGTRNGCVYTEITSYIDWIVRVVLEVDIVW